MQLVNVHIDHMAAVVLGESLSQSRRYKGSWEVHFRN